MWATITAVATVLALVRLLRTALRRESDVGSVSVQWVASHRVESGNDRGL
jgi:hypothetical protein